MKQSSQESDMKSSSYYSNSHVKNENMRNNKSTFSKNTRPPQINTGKLRKDSRNSNFSATLSSSDDNNRPPTAFSLSQQQQPPQPPTQVIINHIQQNSYPNLQIQNNIEITNNIRSSVDGLIIPVQSKLSRSSSHRRSFNLIQKFKIHPLVNGGQEDNFSINGNQFLDVQVTSNNPKPNVKTSRRGSSNPNVYSQQQYNKAMTGDFTPNFHTNTMSHHHAFQVQNDHHDIPSQQLQPQQEFSPLHYGNLSDLDLDSPDPYKKRHHHQLNHPPSPINLNQLYVTSEMRPHTGRRMSHRKRKSSQQLLRTGSSHSHTTTNGNDKVVMVDVLNQSHRQPSLKSNTNSHQNYQYEKGNTIANMRDSYNNHNGGTGQTPQKYATQDHRRMQINIDLLDNHNKGQNQQQNHHHSNQIAHEQQNNMLTSQQSYRKRSSSGQGRFDQLDENENNEIPSSTRNLLDSGFRDEVGTDTLDKLLDHPYQTEERLLKQETPSGQNKNDSQQFDINAGGDQDLNSVTDKIDLESNLKRATSKISQQQVNDQSNNNIKRQESKFSSGTGTDRSQIIEKSVKNQRVFDEICADDAERLRSLKKYDYFIILPDDPFKQKWDLIITINLLFTAIMTPYRIAFYDLDDVTWMVIDTINDGLFGFDMILNFFMAYYDESEDIVDSRKKIAKSYLKSWFIVDLFSIMPISQAMNTSDFSSLARIARLPKLYRLIKIFRLVRLMKVVKERNTLIKQVNDIFKISAGFERLIFFIILSIVVCHICGCFWIIIAKMDDTPIQTWIFRYEYQDLSNIEIYIASMYFTLTTITTVGFGDIVGVTIPERIMCIILMIIGVFSFSFSISSLSSMLSSIDTRNANLNEKMSILNKIQRQYRIGFEFFRRLKMALKYDYQRNAAVQFGFLNELPQNLKIELSLIMHKEIVKKIFFFQNKPPHFIAFIGPLLKPLHIESGNYIYKEKDPIEEIFFLIKGKAALVHKDIKDSAYLIVDQGYYFGEIDFVFQNNDGKRKFTCKAIDNCHLLTIHKADLAKVDIEYEEILADLFMNAQKRLKRTIKIKDESESYFLKQQVQSNHRPSYVGSKEEDIKQIRRMSTALNMKIKKKKFQRQASQAVVQEGKQDETVKDGDGEEENKNDLKESGNDNNIGANNKTHHDQQAASKQLNPINEEDDEEDEDEEEDDDEEDEDDDVIKTDSSFLEKEQNQEVQKSLIADDPADRLDKSLMHPGNANDDGDGEGKRDGDQVDNKSNNNSSNKSHSSFTSSSSSSQSQSSSQSSSNNQSSNSKNSKKSKDSKDQDKSRGSRSISSFSSKGSQSSESQNKKSENKDQLDKNQYKIEIVQVNFNNGNGDEENESPYPRGSLKSSTIQSESISSNQDDTADHNINHEQHQQQRHRRLSKMGAFSLLNNLKLTKKQTQSPSPPRLSALLSQSNNNIDNDQSDQHHRTTKKNNRGGVPVRTQTQVDLNRIKRESSIKKHPSQLQIPLIIKDQLKQQNRDMRRKTKFVNKQQPRKSFMLMRSRTNFKDDKPVIVFNKKVLQQQQQQKEGVMGVSNNASKKTSDKDLIQNTNMSNINVGQQEQQQHEENKSINKGENSSNKRKSNMARVSTLSPFNLQKAELQEQVQSPLKNQITISNLNMNYQPAKILDEGTPKINLPKLSNTSDAKQPGSFNNTTENRSQNEKSQNMSGIAAQQQLLLLQEYHNKNTTSMEQTPKNNKLLIPNLIHQKRKSVLVIKGEGTLLQKIRENSQKNLLPRMQNTVNQVILENQVKRAFIGGGDKAATPKNLNTQNTANITFTHNQATAAAASQLQDDQSKLIVKIENESKDMFHQMDSRISKIEQSVSNIEKSLQILLEQKSSTNHTHNNTNIGSGSNQNGSLQNQTNSNGNWNWNVNGNRDGNVNSLVNHFNSQAGQEQMMQLIMGAITEIFHDNN